MWIYNLTAQVDLDLVEEWKGWLPKFIASELPTENFCQPPKLLWVRSQDTGEGQSFAIQLFFESARSLQVFLGQSDGKIEQASREKFQSKVLYFGSLLEELDWNS